MSTVCKPRVKPVDYTRRKTWTRVRMTWACFYDRVTRREAGKCPVCGRAMVPLGTNVRVPGKTQNKAWKALQKRETYRGHPQGPIKPRVSTHELLPWPSGPLETVHRLISNRLREYTIETDIYDLGYWGRIAGFALPKTRGRDPELAEGWRTADKELKHESHAKS